MTDAEALKLRRARLRAWSDDLFDEVTELPKPKTTTEAAEARRCVQAFDILFTELWSPPKARVYREPSSYTPSAPKCVPAPVAPEPVVTPQPEPEPVPEPKVDIDTPETVAEPETEIPAPAQPASRRRRARKVYGRRRVAAPRGHRRVSLIPARAFRQQAPPTAPPSRQNVAA